MKILKVGENMNMEYEYLSQEEINALLSGGAPSEECSHKKEKVKRSYKGLSTIEILEKIVQDLEHEENVFDEKEEFDQYFAYMIGRGTATSMINDIISELTLVEKDDYVLYRYRGRSIKINRAKYEKTHPNCADIDQYLIACTEDLSGDPLEIDIEKVVCRYSDEEIAKIVDNILDMKIRFFEGYADSNKEQKDQEKRVSYDVLNQYDNKGRKKQEPEPVTITMGERILRAKKRCDF